MQTHPSRTTDHLLGKMWKTKSARFNAHARLRARYWASNGATSMLALYLVALSLCQLTFGEGLPLVENRVLSIGGVVVSIFLIIITLLEAARNYLADADRMHMSALGISELYNRFQALTVEQADLQRLEFNDAYSQALKDIPVDHKDIDQKKFQIRSARDLDIKGSAYFWMRLSYCWSWICEFSLYLGLILFPPAALTVFLLLIHTEAC